MCKYLKQIPFDPETEEFSEEMKTVIPCSFFRRFSLSNPYMCSLVESTNLVKVKVRDCASPHSVALLCLAYACRDIYQSDFLDYGLSHMKEAIATVESKRYIIRQIVSNLRISELENIKENFNLTAEIIKYSDSKNPYLFLLPEPEYVGVFSTDGKHFKVGINKDCGGFLLDGVGRRLL